MKVDEAADLHIKSNGKWVPARIAGIHNFIGDVAWYKVEYERGSTNLRGKEIAQLQEEYHLHEYRQSLEQPIPHEGGQSVTAELRTLLDAREERGIRTYGRSLETFNGRDTPRDLVEELIDAAQYALQWKLERQEMLEVLLVLINQITFKNVPTEKLQDAHARATRILKASRPVGQRTPETPE